MARRLLKNSTAFEASDGFEYVTKAVSQQSGRKSQTTSVTVPLRDISLWSTSYIGHNQRMTEEVILTGVVFLGILPTNTDRGAVCSGGVVDQPNCS